MTLIRIMCKHIEAILCIVTLLVCSISKAADLPENLAPKASISADSQYSNDYLPKFVADSHIPIANAKNDPRKAWCVQGDTHRNGAELIFQWDNPVPVAEIVYYARTAWFLNEGWKGYEIYADGRAQPLAKGRLEMKHGPQQIALPQTKTLRTLKLKFTSSYGGFNPGASEIQIFPTKLDTQQIKKINEITLLQSNPYYKKDIETQQFPKSRKLREYFNSGELGFRFKRIVVIKRHQINPTHVYTYHAEGLQPGGGLYLFTPNKGSGGLKLLVDSPKGIVLDCNLSFDGKVVLFSWKKTMLDKFQIYTINLDGSGLKQITNHESNNMNACWLPDGGIGFLSDRKPAFAYCWVTTSPILYRCACDGGNVVRLSANYLNDFSPSVMEDGRIIYSRWEYVDKPAIPIQSLWTINQDGTCLAGFFGNRVLSPATFMEAREIPGTSKVLCVLTAHNGPCRGAIGIVDPSRGANAQDAIKNLTPEIDIGLVNKGAGNHVRGPYESPFPIDDQYYLVTRNGTVLLRDYKGTEEVTLLEKEDALGFYTARPVKSRKCPPVRPSNLIKQAGKWATLMLHDVYKGLEPHVKRGDIKEIAVVQEVEKSRFASKELRAFGFQFPVVSCGATYAPKKVWGYAKVEEDGSAFFKVPTGVPIYFMAIDRHGRALQRMRSFTHLMPGEQHSCVGCHADRNSVVPRNTARPIAAMRPAQELEKPEWGVRGFSYAHIVQPVLDKHCVECHNATKAAGGVDLSPDRTDFFNVSYEVLARQGKPGQNPYTKWIPTFNGMEANILQITPRHWGSPASKLADIVLKGHPDKNGKPHVKVDRAGQRRVFAWIDLDVPYYGTSSSNHYSLRGCRQILPKDLEPVLKEVAARRCASCHKDGKIPRKIYTRITGIESNNFLMPPLAKSAGGTEVCGKAVFTSREDPDYRAILKTFEPIQELLKKNPRMDMIK